MPKSMRTPEMEVIARQYFAAVNGIDRQFGRIMEYLRTRGMEEDTLVVLSADHGEMMGSHGLMSKNVWFEESLHIPPRSCARRGGLLPGRIRSSLPARTICPPSWSCWGLRCPEPARG